MARSDRVFLALQLALAGAAIEDVAAELAMSPTALMAELAEELEARGGAIVQLAVLEPGDLAEVCAEIRGLPETADRDG